MTSTRPINAQHRLVDIVLTLSIMCASACRTESHDAPPAQNSVDAPAEPAAKSAPALEAFTLTVPGCTAKLEMRPIPAGEVEVSDANAPETKHSVDVAPLWFASTETTWDMYDAFVFAMDRAQGDKDPPDAWTRPSKPYILMDRGFGHAGYPAISVSYRGATEFCKWLSAKTQKHFRLPTESEWEHACRAGSKGNYDFGDDASLLADHAWFRDNSTTDNGPSTHPVALKKPNAWGLYDMHGNAAEWTAGADGKGIAKGGAYKDSAENLTIAARRLDERALNQTDPQIPKSVWWLADGPFIGFRVVCAATP